MTAFLIRRFNVEWYWLYIRSIMLTGFLLVCWSLVQLRTLVPLDVFGLVTLLIIAAAFSTTSVAVSNRNGVTYAIEGAITLAAAPFFGYAGVILLVAIHNLALLILKPRNAVTWKRSFEQFGFNLGMHTMGAAAATFVLLRLMQVLGETTLLGRSVPWLLAATTDTGLNLLLIAVVLRLQNGANFRLLEFLRGNAWAMQISILMLSIGGALLAFAIGTYDALGVVIFFLPILLSSYAFRLYVRQMQSHLDNLENIVAERTTDLQLRTQELADLNKQKDTYLAVLTHDMMTPLSNIQLCTEILREDTSLSANNRELAALMLRSQRMLFGMVRNILDIEKLRVGEPLKMLKAPYDMGLLTGQMVQLLRAEAADRQISIGYTPPQSPAVGLVDKSQFERVLLNLMGNALKYSPTESFINVRVWEASAEILVEVADTGFGIPADQLPHIFDQYRRVEEHADKATGTGLGLAITKAIVEAHGGSISAESTVGKGSTFCVRLPAPAIQPQDVLDYEG